LRRASVSACAGPCLLAGVGLWLLAFATAPARAHSGGSTGYASITVHRSTVRYRLTMPVATLTAPMAEDLRLAQTGSAPARERLLDVVRRTIVLRSNGTRCEPGPGVVEPSAPDAVAVTLLVDFACPPGLRDLDVEDDLFDVVGPDHHTLARIEWPGGTGQFAFEPSARVAHFSVGGSPARAVGSFLGLGIHHILSGYDHLLFLLGLLLSGGGLLALAKIITAFTLAHSVTLSLAVLDVVVLPDRLVEAVIALSIAFVAAENLAPRPAVSRRWLVSFLFGLVHGFGFSSALRELGLGRQGLALSLVGFNVGVEAGQALVIAILLPVLVLLRRSRWQHRAVHGSSVAILVIGLILFVERVFL
jgi:HupE/UreJ protein